MNLRQLILTNNACFKAGRTITPRGIMVHSTGANNPWLRRYVGPDDGLLGINRHNNHWNQDRPDGRLVCVHAFIGKLADGSIATYQTLPWNHRGWHCGRGVNGTGNDTHISFEICEDGLDDAVYFRKVYSEAVKLCVYLCRQYGLSEQEIISHSEGHRLGIASNHADVMHWFPRHGENMDSFRAAVKAALSADATDAPIVAPIDALYRVRKSWDDVSSQIGAFRVLDNAKRLVDTNPGYAVYDNTGGMVYGGTGVTEYEIYSVVKGDSLWRIAASKLGNGARFPEIKELNALTSDIIVPGQKLKIPK